MKGSLSEIMNSVIDECNLSGGDSAVRGLQRKFEKFIEAGGGRKSDLQEKGRIRIKEEDEPIIRLILKQLAMEDGWAFTFAQRKPKQPDLDSTRQFLAEFAAELRKSGVNEIQIKKGISTL